MKITTPLSDENTEATDTRSRSRCRSTDAPRTAPSGNARVRVVCDTVSTVAIMTSNSAPETRPTWTTAAPSVTLISDGSEFTLETLWIGPETLAVHRHDGPASLFAPALVALTDADRVPPAAAVFVALSAQDVALADPAWRPVLEYTAGLLLMWLRPSATSLHRTTDGTWVTYHNPDPLVATREWVVVRATLEHVEGMSALDAVEYLEPLAQHDIAEAVTRYPCAVALRDDEVIGMAITRDMVGTDGVLGELFTIVTHPARRSRGLGAALLAYVEQMAFERWEALSLESSMSYESRYKSSPAPFYLRNGWTLVGINEHAVYMIKTKPGTSATILDTGGVPLPR